MGLRKNTVIKKIILLARISSILSVLLIYISGCSLEEFGNIATKTADKNVSDIGNYLGDGEQSITFDSYSAEDVISGPKDLEDNCYYDEKSGEYVSAAQYRANHLVDAIKIVWLPSCALSIFVGVIIRKLVKGSATIRRLGLFLEAGFPIIFSTLVYILCACADSSIIKIFNFFVR